MSDFTPDDEFVRDHYFNRTLNPVSDANEFDRWLAKHDAEVLSSPHRVLAAMENLIEHSAVISSDFEQAAVALRKALERPRILSDEEIGDVEYNLDGKRIYRRLKDISGREVRVYQSYIGDEEVVLSNGTDILFLTRAGAIEVIDGLTAFLAHTDGVEDLPEG